MRVLFLCDSYRPGGEGHLLQQLARELSHRGHAIDIISMDRPDGMAPEYVEEPNGLRVYFLGRRPRWAPTRGPVRYLPNIWRLRMNPRLNRWLRGHYHGFLFSTPAVLSAGLPHSLRDRGVVERTAFILWDFFPRAQVESGVLSLGPIESLLHRLEAQEARAADVLLPMTDGGAQFASTYLGTTPDRYRLLLPWASEVPISEDVTKYERFTCVWGGQFVARRAIPDLLGAAEELQRQGVAVDFRLAGGGDLLGRAKEIAAQRHLENVFFEGHLSRGEYARLVRRCHLGLSLLEHGSAPAFPSKTADYCQAGLPVIASRETSNDYGDVVESEGAGVAVPVGQPRAIAEAIQAIAQLPPEQRFALSVASRQFYETRMTVAAAANAVEEVFES